MKRRVVITGIGAVTPAGNNVDTYWDSVLKAKSAITRITRFDPSRLASQIAGEVKDFEIANHIPRKLARNLERFSQYSVVAAEEALCDAGFLPKIDEETNTVDHWRIDDSLIDPFRFGSVIGVGLGGLDEIEHGKVQLEKRGPGRISPFFVPKSMANAASGHIAIRFGLKGTNFVCTSACASGAHAIFSSLRSIQFGDADVMVTGATESTLTELCVASFCSARALSTRNDDPEHSSRPFDKNRDGFVIAEGAGILVFEELEHARKRGAKIYAEVVGVGATDDAYHITAPDPSGIGPAKAIEFAIRESGIPKEKYNYINAHGTSTQLNDPMETNAIKSVFGDYAKKIAISSTKSVIGHLLGGAGGAELVCLAKAIKEGIIPPTANYEVPDPECDLDYVPNVPREEKIYAALSNSLGFGGHNATIALKIYEND
ncbi:MAG: beta-ketoacyl-ACP synthase II [Planctomycetes bacterium]|nr:beta-ketoacyl-ACP synthase II [Planctomycetota bacterium]